MSILSKLEKSYQCKLRTELVITKQQFATLTGLLNDDEWNKLLKALKDNNATVLNAILQRKIDLHLAKQAATWRVAIEQANNVGLDVLGSLWDQRG